MSLDLKQIHQEVVKVLDQSEKISCSYFDKNVKAIIKEVKRQDKLSTDVVTQADRDIEELIVRSLGSKFPQIGYLGEESKTSKIKEYNWIIDPIDGTLNFIWGVPIFCHSIALWKGMEPIYGAGNQTVTF
jgi:myo-inositol-1(or 4)-monophosphatase